MDKERESVRSDWLFVAIEEYKTLRMEILEAIKLQYSIIQIGLTTIGLLIALLPALIDKEYLPQVFLLILIPATSYITLLLWIGEVERMMRAGIYIFNLEEEVRNLFKDMPSPLNWETWLKGSTGKAKHIDRHMTSNYKAVIALYLGAAMASFSIGGTNYFKFKMPPKIQLIVYLAECAIFFAMFLYFYKRGTNIRDYKIVKKRIYLQ